MKGMRAADALAESKKKSRNEVHQSGNVISLSPEETPKKQAALDPDLIVEETSKRHKQTPRSDRQKQSLAPAVVVPHNFSFRYPEMVPILSNDGAFPSYVAISLVR